MIPASEALQRLKDGNQRFVTNMRDLSTSITQTQRADLVEAQTPFAIVLGCSDSRVPAEIVFDQGLGDLFVIRVAGNVVAPSLLGSVEFAASQFNVQLVVVLGHSKCGAIAATINALQHPQDKGSPNIQSIVNRIRPSVETLMETDIAKDHDKLIEHAIRANVRTSVSHLQHGSQLLEELVANDKLRIVGAEYSLDTGLVDFFDADLDAMGGVEIEH